MNIKHNPICALVALVFFSTYGIGSSLAATSGLDSTTSPLIVAVTGQQAMLIAAQSSSAPNGLISFTMPTSLFFPLTAGNTLLNTDGSITTNVGLTINNPNGGVYASDIIAPHRIASGDQVNGGNGGVSVGPGQFFGSLSSTQVGIYNGQQWRLDVHNDGWIAFDNEVAQIGGWPNNGGYDYATFGVDWGQQLILRNDNNAFFFAWDTPGVLNINGNLNIDNPAHNASLCLNGTCTTSLGGGSGVNSLYSVCGYFSDMGSWYQNAGRDNYRTGGKSCPASTTDVIEMGAYDGTGRVCYMHVCYNN